MLRYEASKHSILIDSDFSLDLPPIRADRVRLPISRSIIQSHGDRLWADTNPESGSIFVSLYPLSVLRTKRRSCAIVTNVKVK